MALLSCSVHNQNLFASNFLYCFRNVMKLKKVFLKDSNKQTVVCSKKFSNYFGKYVPPDRVRVSYCCNLHLINQKHSFRWSRYSKSGFFMTTNSRKKNKRSLFSEEMRIKLQAGKLKETKKKVKKTINEIKENVLTIPNGLCVARIISSPILAYLILSEFYSASLGLFVFAGFTDLIDGYIARNFPNQQSMIGSFLDPAADKLLIATLFVTLTYNGLIPVPLTSLIIVRDACLMSAGFYIRYVSLPPPKSLSRYFDMSFVTAKLQPTGISKANTLIQLSLAAASLAAPVFCYVDHFYLHVLWYITGTTTVLSAASYLYYKKSTYKLFSAQKKNNQ